jgi:hypothetical protein
MKNKQIALIAKILDAVNRALEYDEIIEETIVSSDSFLLSFDDEELKVFKSLIEKR